MTKAHALISQHGWMNGTLMHVYSSVWTSLPDKSRFENPPHFSYIHFSFSFVAADTLINHLRPFGFSVAASRCQLVLRIRCRVIVRPKHTNEPISNGFSFDFYYFYLIIWRRFIRIQLNTEGREWRQQTANMLKPTDSICIIYTRDEKFARSAHQWIFIFSPVFTSGWCFFPLRSLPLSAAWLERNYAHALVRIVISRNLAAAFGNIWRRTSSVPS